MPTETVAKPRTLKEAGAIIRSLSLPLPPVDRLMTLARMESVPLKDDLYQAINQMGEWERSKQRAFCALNACTDWFEANLASLGYELTLEERVAKAVAYGPDLIGTVQRAALATDEGDTAKRMLRSILSGTPSTPAPTTENPSSVGRADAATSRTSQTDPPERKLASPSTGIPASAPPQAAGDDADKKYVHVHVYGGKAAACFSADTKRNSTAQTVRIETAEATAPRAYAWDNKIAIQLSVKELPLVLGVLMGWLPAYKVEGHGENHDKGFSIERQEGKFFLSMFTKGKNARALPIPPGDAYCVTSLVLRQMVANDPHLTSAEVLKLTHSAISVVPNASDTRH